MTLTAGFLRAAAPGLESEAPLTARLIETVAEADSVAVYDPAGYFTDLAAMHDLGAWKIDGVYVQRIEEAGQNRAGFKARPLTEAWARLEALTASRAS